MNGPSMILVGYEGADFLDLGGSSPFVQHSVIIVSTGVVS